MLKYCIAFFILIFWILFLDRAFPSDKENSTSFTLIVFIVLLIWILGGIILFIKKTIPAIKILVAFFIITSISIYIAFPWFNGYSGYQIIKDYTAKKRSIKNVEISWLYSLPLKIENFPYIDLAQQKFAKVIKPDKCYLFRCFYYDSSQIQTYVDEYMIYLKNKIPFTTKDSLSFSKDASDSFIITERINDKIIIDIICQNNIVKIKTPIENHLQDQNGENYFIIVGKYRFELKRVDIYNGLDIRNTYWVYKFL